MQRYRNAPSGYIDNVARSLSTIGNDQSKADMDDSGDCKRVHAGPGSGGKTALRAKHWRESRKSDAMGDCNTHCQGITRDYFGKQLCAGNRVSRLRRVDVCSRVLCRASWFEAEAGLCCAKIMWSCVARNNEYKHPSILVS